MLVLFGTQQQVSGDVWHQHSMALTLQQKRQKADTFFDNLYSLLRNYFQQNGFKTIPAQKLNIPKFEEVDVYMRVLGTANNANLDVMVEDAGIYYARRDTVVNGVRSSGSWSQIATPNIENIIQGPPYSICVNQTSVNPDTGKEENNLVYVTF